MRILLVEDDLVTARILELLLKRTGMNPYATHSGDDAFETKLKGFGSGADDYLTKPFQHDELLALILALETGS